MATDAPQRHYRAPCPSCGAPVEFASAQTPYAVCGYCRSTVSASTGISRDKLDRYYSHGTEPRYCDGEALITFWCLATGKPRSSLPKISRYDYRF